jgi:hypothetical protein
VAPGPGRTVILTFKALPGAYSSENWLEVSPDGCMMRGTFMDSEGHKGQALYQWQGGV